MALPPDPLPADVLAALQRGGTIEAIKLLRESTGLGLKEAKDIIDRHASGQEVSVSAGVTPAAIPPDVAALMLQGNKIDAIRLLREQTGMGLKEAKDAVEAIQERNKGAQSRLAPGEIARPGNGTWIVATLVAVAVLAWLVFDRAG